MIEAVIVALAAFLAGYALRAYLGRNEREEAVRTAVRSEEERRAEAMRIYNRTTWPEDDGGSQPSRVTDVDIG